MSLINRLAQGLLQIDKLDLPPDLNVTLEDVARESRERMRKELGHLLRNSDCMKHSSLQGAMSPIESLAQELLQIDKLDLPPDLIVTLKGVARESREHMGRKVGHFLHEDLDSRKHSEKQVKDIINAFPEALSCTNDFGKIPLQGAIWYSDKISFVPLLAEEGNRHDVGGEENRGGLLLNYPIEGFLPHGVNGIQALTFQIGGGGAQDILTVDEMALQVLKRLRKMRLLFKEDIRRFNLLGFIAWTRSMREFRLRFQFLHDWNPEVLKEANVNGDPILHLVPMLKSNQMTAKEDFEMILQANLRHFPNDLGLLFQKHDGNTACEVALYVFGKRATMDIIRRCIPPSENCPILHQVNAYTPKLFELFASYYPDAIYLRDSENRTLFQSILASGKMRFSDHALFFLQATKEQLKEKDPVAELFPFALAASGDTSDLTAVYILLRREPDLIWGMKSSNQKKRRGKRKRKMSS